VVPGVRLVVLGKQGAGKGTQCVRLSHHYVVPHISTGDMLRAAVKTGSVLGMKVQETMDRGELLGDDIIMEMVADRLDEPDARARGFILDGCPRTTHQAEALVDHLHDQLVGDQLTAVHDRGGPQAELGARLHRGPQHVARGDVRHHVVVGQANTLGSLAGPLLAEDHEPDAGDHAGLT